MSKRWTTFVQYWGKALLLPFFLAMAGDCWGQLDHRVNPDTSGIWNPNI